MFSLGSLGDIGARTFQGLCSIIVLGTAGAVASRYNSAPGVSSPSEVNFIIFAAVWSLLAIIALSLAPRVMGDARGPVQFGLIALDALTMLFWFAAFIAMAVWTDNHCLARCHSAGAATAFGAFAWVAFTITTVFLVLPLLSRSSTKTNDHQLEHQTPTTATPVTNDKPADMGTVA